MQTATKPRFSIVIPCYNEAAYITKTLEALQAQDYRGNYEIIVVNNNCTDGTATIAERFGVRIVQESRPGVCWARQAGTQAANGEIIISTDADTVHAPTWLSRIAASFRKHPQAVAVAGPCRYYDGPVWGKLYPRLLFGGVSLYTRIVGRPFYITATNTAFKKAAWSGYDTSLTQGGDELDLLHRLSERGSVIFDNSNPAFTSARRLTRGLLYNLIFSFLLYYLLEYHLSKRFKRPVFGPAPAYRDNSSPRFAPGQALTLVAVVTLLSVHSPGIRHEMSQTSYRVTEAAADLIKDLPR